MPHTRRSTRINSRNNSIKDSQDETSKPFKENKQTKKTGKKETSENLKQEKVICAGCAQEDPPKTALTDKTTTWLSCDLCSQWWHCICAGYNSDEAEIFVREQIKFPCALCIIKQPYINCKVQQNTVQKETDRDLKIDKLLEITKNLGESVLEYSNTEKISGVKKNNYKADQTDPDTIIIIDNIEKSSIARDSTSIRKELAKIQDLSGNIEEAYSLPKGGVAIHLKDKSARDKIIQNWQKHKTSFGENSAAHKPKSVADGINIVYLHNIPTYMTEESIHQELKHLYDIVVVNRKRYRDTGKPMPVVRVVFKNQNQAKIALASKGFCHPGTNTYSTFQPDRKFKIVRCYNCNKFGHISKWCLNQHTCANCGKENCAHSNCKATPCCINCGGIHPSTSGKCKKYLDFNNRRRLYNILKPENEDPPAKCTSD